MLRVVVCVSGGGTNLQAMIDGIKEGRINNAGIVRVISNNRDAYALKRAEENHIPGVCISPKDYADREAFHKALLEAVREAEPDLIVLAGFLVVIPKEMIAEYTNKIINIHPSLIPSFCGIRILWDEGARRRAEPRGKNHRGDGAFCRRRHGYRSDSVTETGGNHGRRYAGNIAEAGYGRG